MCHFSHGWATQKSVVVQRRAEGAWRGGDTPPMEWLSAISVGAEYGGPEVPDWLIEEQVRLNQLLDKYCTRPYNDEVPAITLALRVEASLKSYGPTGVAAVKRYRRYGAVGANISVERRDWNTNAVAYRDFLWRIVCDAIQACVARLKNDGLAVDEERLRQDLSKVKIEFLSGS